jgi:hypothetical protein
LGRHPTAAFLVFGVSPVVSLIFAMICSLVAMQLFCQLARICDEDIGSALPYVGSLGLIILPSVLVSVSYCELARRLGIAKKWTVIACVVVACIAALNGFCESISASGERYTHDGIGFHSPMQLVQFLIPLWIGWCYARPERDRHGSLIAFLVFAASPILLLMMLFALEIIGFSILHVIFGKEISLPFGIVIDGWEWKVPTTAGGILFIVISLALTIGPCGLLSVFYWKLAGWFDIRKRWALVSCFLLAFVAILPGYFERDMCRPEQLYLGRVEQLGQFLIPLAVGWWFMRRKRADSPQLVAAAA